MVKRFFGLFNKEISGLHEAAFLLGLSALTSQLLALVRDRMLVANVGAGSGLDVYYAAFRVPDLVYVTIASFVSVTVLIPFLIKRIESGEKEEARRFLNESLTVFLVVMLIVSFFLYIFAPHLAVLVAPGFDPISQTQLILVMRILLLSPLLLGLSNLLGSVTQSMRQFFIYALSPVFYNLGIIVGIVVFFPLWGLAGLGWGVILGAFLHLGIQLPTIIKSGFLPRPTRVINWNEIWRVVKISFPRTLALATQQFSLFVLVSIASYLSKGSIALFNLSFNLQSAPLAIVGISYSVAAFPSLAKVFANNHRDEFLRQLANATRHIIFWAAPATALFIVLRAQIVRVILGAGNFNWTSTRLTAAALAIFAVSVLAQSLVLLFVRAYYAAGRTSKPLIINASSALITIVLAYLLGGMFRTWPLFRYFTEALLRVSDLSGTELLVLPMAFSVGALINVFIFLMTIKKDFGCFRREVTVAFYQSFAASVFGGFLAYRALPIFGFFLDVNTFWGIFLQGFLSGVVGLTAHMMLLQAIKSQDLKEVWSTLKTRFWKVRVVAPEPESL